MNEKFVEKIRQFLIKTVLPIQRRKERFLSKLRLSLTFRIAVNYAKLFVINGIVTVLLFGIVFVVMFSRESITKMNEVIENVKLQNYEGEINPYINDGISVKVIENKGRRVIYDDSEGEFDYFDESVGRVYFSFKKENEKLLVFNDFSENIAVDGEMVNGKIYFCINYSSQYHSYVETLKIMLLIIIILSIVMSVSGSHQLQFIMIPIKKMSEAANKLTVNNLGSERLDIEGTKNELKDLAATINEMLDRLELSYESQKQFVSDASHELRTPIAVIQGYVNMVDRWGKEDPSIMEESIAAIKEEAESMKGLVEKLLFLSRHDKKTLKLDKKFFNMGEVVEEMLKETAMVAKDRVIDTNGTDEVIVYGDKQSLKQAVRVFIDNAIKYSSEGDKITISCKNEKGNCIISVEDTGIGMREKDMDNIFERFYRSDDVRNRSIGGHGLGLSIAKLIVLKHTGTIKIRSQYLKGSCFTIVLPRIYR